MLVDYHAFERSPEATGWGPRRDARGFVEVDARMATSEPGVYAAGDVTGRFASALIALGDGTTAAFSAYVDTYRRKLGREPNLFAYAALEPPRFDVPEARPFPLPEDAAVVPLGKADALARLLTPFGDALAVVRDGGTVAAFHAAAGLSPAAGDALLFRALHQRLVTLHRRPGAGPEPR